MLKAETINLIQQNILPDDIVIIAPLNWGLGHATRCIPIIQWLKIRCRQVIIASDGIALEILRKEFPELLSFELPSYHIRYPFEYPGLNMMAGLPSIINASIREKQVAKKIQSKTKATVIISDNRFGFRCENTRNYYITHQVNILHPSKIIAKIAGKIHTRIIEKFDQCWIPDYVGHRSLAGDLSKSGHLKNKMYIGPVSRILSSNLPKKWDICVLLSGPEPQRSILENKLMELLKHLIQYKILFIRGVPEASDQISLPKNIHIVNMADTTKVSEALNSSQLLISRSGYTTIMDIEHLDIKAIFIPTPGQTEQEYLAERLSDFLKYDYVKQSECKNILPKIEKFLAVPAL